MFDSEATVGVVVVVVVTDIIDGKGSNFCVIVGGFEGDVYDSVFANWRIEDVEGSWAMVVVLGVYECVHDECV